MRCSSNHLSTPTCAIPSADPPPSANPILGRGLDGSAWPKACAAEQRIPNTAQSARRPPVCLCISISLLIPAWHDLEAYQAVFSSTKKIFKKDFRFFHRPYSSLLERFLSGGRATSEFVGRGAGTPRLSFLR